VSRVARRPQLNHSTSRTLAALVGSLPASLLLGIALAAALPVRLELRYLIGAYSVVPLWAGLACCLFLVRSARRAWLWLAFACALATVVSWLALRAR
jgi:hypothetical protein